MDPLATLAWLLESLADGDSFAAEQAAGDLAEWLNRGGFEPDSPLGELQNTVKATLYRSRNLVLRKAANNG